jgi:hypothetical protein
MQWSKKGSQGAAKLTVPAAIARIVGSKILFKVELTQDGILFRYVRGRPAYKPSELPAWLRQEG